MKKKLMIVFIILIVFYASLYRYRVKLDEDKLANNLIEINEKYAGDIELIQINDQMFMHKSYAMYQGSKVSANGLLVETSDGVLMIDTPWTVEQTNDLINISRKLFSKEINKSIVTHAHADTIGGIESLLDNNIEVIATELTLNEAKNNDYKLPTRIVKSGEIIDEIDVEFEIFYPGHGHAKDNIVVWIPKHKTLFAGCIIKSLESKTLGNTDDANIYEWEKSVSQILDRFDDIEVVIPGHGLYGDSELIRHTVYLLENELIKIDQ